MKRTIVSLSHYRLLVTCLKGDGSISDPSSTVMSGPAQPCPLPPRQARRFSRRCSPTGQPAWAALSTSGLRIFDLPNAVRDVIALSDGDDPVEAAVKGAALRSSRKGRCAGISGSPHRFDFNHSNGNPPQYAGKR
jgi:putative DNA primase/helicase